MSPGDYMYHQCVSKLPAVITVVAIDKGLRKSTIIKSHCNYICVFAYFSPQTKISVTSLVFVRFLYFFFQIVWHIVKSKLKGMSLEKNGNWA